MTKQVRAEKKGGSSQSAPKSGETSLPKDTFESWIEKQKPKEAVQQKSDSSVPDTFDLWMSKQVSIRESEEKAGTPETPAASTI